jgi:hypothetical protein
MAQRLWGMSIPNGLTRSLWLLLPLFDKEKAPLYGGEERERRVFVL